MEVGEYYRHNPKVTVLCIVGCANSTRNNAGTIYTTFSYNCCNVIYVWRNGLLMNLSDLHCRFYAKYISKIFHGDSYYETL